MCLKGKKCGLPKHCLSGVRHTFATMVTLSKGVPVETVGKMLGHCNLKATPHYARMLDAKIAQDLQALRKNWKAKQKETTINNPFSLIPLFESIQCGSLVIWQKKEGETCMEVNLAGETLYLS